MKKHLLKGLGAFLLTLSVHSIFAQDIWVPTATNAFSGDVYNKTIKCMHVFKGNIYAGIGEDTAAIYSSPTGNPGSWQNKFSSGPMIYGIESFGSTAEGGGYMYAGTNGTGNPVSQLLRTSDGNTWQDIYDASGAVSQIMPFKGLGTVDSIYVVEYNYNGDVISRAPYDSNDPTNSSGTWVQTFNLSGTYENINCWQVFNGKLYVGSTAGNIYYTPDGTNWQADTAIGGSGFGDGDNYEISAMGTYDGYFYAATYNNSEGSQIWRSADDITWTQVSQFSGYSRITSFAVSATTLWIALTDDDGGVGAVYKSADGLVFSVSQNNGFNTPGDDGQYAQLQAFGNNMYCSTQNYVTGGGKGLTTSHSIPHTRATVRGGGTSTGGEIWRTCLGTPPVVNLGADTTICEEQAITLNAGIPGAIYSWNTGDTTQTINATGTFAGATYTVFITDANGCSAQDMITITNKHLPTLAVITPFSQSAVVCAHDSISLLNQASSNYRQWLTPMHYQPAADTIHDNQTANDTVSVSGVGDLASASIMTVTLDSLYHTYDGDIEIVLYAPDGSSVELSNQNGDGGDNYIGTVFSASSLNDITMSSPPFTGTFAPQGGFGSLSGPADGNWILSVTDHAGGDEGIVKGWSMQFSTPDTVLTLSWTPSTGLSSSSILSPELTPPAGTTIYTLTATNNGGCSAQISDTVFVPVIHIAATADSLCAGGTAGLTVTGAINPTWSPAAALSSTSGFSVTAFPATTTVYAVSDTVSGCYAQDSITIYMDAALIVNAGADQTICHGDSATIAGVVNGGTMPYAYLWTNGNSNLSQIVSPATTTNYGLTVTDAFGCTKANSSNINVNASTDIYGHVSYSGGNVTSSNVVIYKYEPFLVHFDTVQVATTDASGNYHLTAIDHFTYLIEVFPAASDTTLVPTYYGNSFLWDSATVVTHDCMMADTFNIAMTEEVSFGTGPGYLHGQIIKGPGYDSHPGYPMSGSHERGEPIPGIDVKLGRNPGGQMVTSTTTNSTGEYSFSGVAYGNYTVYADVPGLGRDSSYTFTVDSVNAIYNYLNYVVDSTTVHYVPDAGVGVQSLVKNENRLNVYPNPSKGDATIQYSIDKDAEVSLGIYNVLGVKITEMVNTHQQAGTYRYNMNDKNSGLNSGVYFVTLMVNGKTSIRRIVVTE